MSILDGKEVTEWTTKGITCYIFDIDGTIADLTHRRKWIETKPKNWKAFEAGMADDKPINHVIQVLVSVEMYSHIVLCSGRGEQNRETTEKWLATHGIPYDALYMRAEKDYRADDIVKEELLDRILADGWNPLMVFDDRQRVVDMWRRRGIPCAQVAEGDF